MCSSCLHFLLHPWGRGTESARTHRAALTSPTWKIYHSSWGASGKGRTKCSGVTWKYKLCVLHGFCTNINFPVCLLLPQLLCFSQERGAEAFCSMQISCRKTEYGVTHYMLCEVTRQLCYRAFVLGLVQSPADYLVWRAMSRTQALPQRGQGSKDTVFSLCFPKTFTSCIMCQLSVVLCRGRGGGERGVDVPLSSLCSFHVALQRHDSIHLVWQGHS